MPGGLTINDPLTVSRAKGIAAAVGAVREQRVDPYGAIPVQNITPTKHGLADEGSYFITTNPTIGTGVAHALTTAFSATAGLFVLQNTSPSLRVYLDYLRLIHTSAAPTATVSMHFAGVLDTGQRVPTAGSQVLTPVNVNGDDQNRSMLAVYAFNAAALTVPAAANAKTVLRAALPVSQVVTGDEYILQFGGVDHAPIQGLTAVRATAPARLVTNVAPVIIGPGQSLVLYRWCLTEATTAPSYEFEIGHWER